MKEEIFDAKIHFMNTKLNFQHTDGDSSAAILLPFPGASGVSSSAAMASMDAAMPALSL